MSDTNFALAKKSFLQKMNIKMEVLLLLIVTYITIIFLFGRVAKWSATCTRKSTWLLVMCRGELSAVTVLDNVLASVKLMKVVDRKS